MTPEKRALLAVEQMVTPERWADVTPEMRPVVFSPYYQPIHDAIVAAESRIASVWRQIIVEEREACARLAQRLYPPSLEENAGPPAPIVANTIADAIRARGNAA